MDQSTMDIIIQAKDEATNTFRQVQNGAGGLRDTLKSTGRQMQSTGRTATKSMTLPIVGAGVAIGKMGGEFEQSMSKVEALTGATGEELEGMNQLAQDLGSTTQFSASQAADAMGFLGMAGFETKDIMSGLPSVLDLAAAGGLDLARAGDIASNVLQGFGMEAEETARVSDVLAATASSANTSVEQMGEAMKMVAPVATSSGIALEETSAIIGALGDAGIQGTMAGTTMRGMLASLEAPTGKAAKAIKELGLETHDAQGDLLPMADIVEQLEEKGLSTADAMDIFGRRAGPGMSALVEKGSDALREQTSALEESEGRAKSMADTMMDNLFGSLKEAKSAFEGFAITLFDSGFGDFVRDMIDKATGALRRLSEWWETLDGDVQALIGGIAGLAAVIGPLLVAMGTLSVIIGTISAPMLIVVAAVAALGAAAFALAKHWDTLMDFMKPVFDFIDNRVRPAFDRARAIIEEHVMPVLEQLWGFIKGQFKKAWEDLKTAVGDLSDIWEQHSEKVIMIAKIIGGVLLGPLAAAALAIGVVIAVGIGLITFFARLIGWLSKLSTWFWDTMFSIQDSVNNMWSRVGEILGSFISFMASLPERIGAFIDNLIAWFRNLPRNIGFLIGRVVKTLITFATQTVPQFVSNVITFMKKLPGRVWNIFQRMRTRAINTARSMVNSTVSFMRNLPGRVIRAVSSLISSIASWASDVATKMKNGIKDGIGDVVETFKGLPGKALEALQGMGGKVKERLKNIGSDAWQGFKEGMGIDSPSLIERSLMDVARQGDETTKQMRRQVRDLQSMSGRARELRGQERVVGGRSQDGGQMTTERRLSMENVTINLMSEEAARGFFDELDNDAMLSNFGFTPGRGNR